MAGPDDIKGLKSRLAGLKRRRQFVQWGQSRYLAAELGELLMDIENARPDPETGAELVASFYETDKAILGNCDDSSGYIGDVYRLYAQELFVGFAAECEDKAWVADLVAELNRVDDFDVRSTVVRCAAEYLPELEIRRMIAVFHERAGAESGEWPRRHWLNRVESLARQVGDARLFERTRLASWERISTAACVDIAEVYLETGDAEAALSWLERIDPEETFEADERDNLLVAALGQVGRVEDQEVVAWRLFRRRRSAAGLNQLLGVFGKEQRESVVEAEVQHILRDPEVSYSNAGFLAEIERFDAVAEYFVTRADRLDGDYYEILVPLAEAMEATGRPLAASVVYRALIESILKKARSKIYHYAVRYLRKLDLLATQVPDWGSAGDHEQFFDGLQSKHGRKTSFWSRCAKSRPR